jgi:hypothetical protein
MFIWVVTRHQLSGYKGVNQVCTKGKIPRRD